MHTGAVVIGTSAGGMKALAQIIPKLPANFPVPIIIVQHISPYSDNYITVHLNKLSKINVKEADEKERLKPGNAYIAPPNYHLLIELNKTLSLATSERVSFSRPSIDILFDTAAEAYTHTLIGVLLTGANSDGANGLLKIHEFGGVTIVQNPDTAEVNTMPQSALDLFQPTKILDVEKIADYLMRITA